MATVDVLQQQSTKEEDEISAETTSSSDSEVEALSSSSSPTTHRQGDPCSYQWLLQHTGLSTTPQDLSQLIKLELANCNLTSLPNDLPTLLPNLEILFCPKNRFVELPAVIGQCQRLRMVSFKECHSIRRIPPEALQPQLQWLILTGNLLEELPDTIARCTQLQKCMLSGNQLQTLPVEAMAKLQNLELIRLACNRLQEPPLALLQECKNLRWAAFASNPFLEATTKKKGLISSSLSILNDPCLDDTTAAEVLGKGAGGITRKVFYQQGGGASTSSTPVAVKTFVGELTSDGSPQDEKAINVMAATLKDPALIQLLGETSQGSLVMEFLDGYQALAGPPSFDTCSRDVYSDTIAATVSPEFAWKIATELLRVLTRLHSLSICHADFYAHNILIHPALQQVKLSDFGAAFFYDAASDYGNAIRKVELRAYTVLVKELYDLVILPSNSSSSSSSNDAHPWKDLLEDCQNPTSTFEVLQTKFVHGTQ